MNYYEKKKKDLITNFYLCSSNLSNPNEIRPCANGIDMISMNCLASAVDMAGKPFRIKVGILYVGKPNTKEAGIIYPNDDLFQSIGKVNPSNLPMPN